MASRTVVELVAAVVPAVDHKHHRSSPPHRHIHPQSPLLLPLSLRRAGAGATTEHEGRDELARQEGNQENEAWTIEIQRHSRVFLPGFKVPKQVLIVRNLPRTVTGKVQKHLLLASLMTWGGVSVNNAVGAAQASKPAPSEDPDGPIPQKSKL